MDSDILVHMNSEVRVNWLGTICKSPVFGGIYPNQEGENERTNPLRTVVPSFPDWKDPLSTSVGLKEERTKAG